MLFLKSIKLFYPILYFYARVQFNKKLFTFILFVYMNIDNNRTHLRSTFQVDRTTTPGRGCVQTAAPSRRCSSNMSDASCITTPLLVFPFSTIKNRKTFPRSDTTTASSSQVSEDMTMQKIVNDQAHPVGMLKIVDHTHLTAPPSRRCSPNIDSQSEMLDIRSEIGCTHRYAMLKHEILRLRQEYQTLLEKYQDLYKQHHANETTTSNFPISHNNNNNNEYSFVTRATIVRCLFVLFVLFCYVWMIKGNRTWS